MTRLLPLVVAMLLQPLGAQTAKKLPPETPIKIAARAERESAVYHQGEKVIFNLAVTDAGKPAEGLVEWTVVKDGLPTEQKGQASLIDGKAIAEASLNEPGFIQVKVSYRTNPQAKVAPITGLGGAAVDPEQIKRSLPVPDDFDAFWAQMKSRLAKVPVAPVLTPVPSTIKSIDSFDVQAPALGLPVSAYLARPTRAKPKSLPIILTVQGAGVNDSSLGGSAGWASRGFLAMDMNAHGLPNGKPRQYYTDLYAGPMKDYRFEHRDNREQAYFTGMMLRLVRAIDILTAQPEWDGKHVVVYGSSQGGYQAIAAAGLDSRVTFFAAGVPAGCDHSGMLMNRIAGWPKVVPWLEGKPDLKVIEAYRYLDCMNFATRTKAAGCALTVGFIDSTCPPTSVYAAYNQLSIPKQIFNDVLSGHSHSKAASASMSEAVLRHVKE